MRQKNQSNKPIRGLVLELRPDDNQKVLLSKHLNDKIGIIIQLLKAEEILFSK